MMSSYTVWFDPYDNKKYIKETDTHIEAFGGDGTLLKAIKMHRDKGKPFFGIAGGTENFLMNREDFIHESASYEKFSLIKVNVTYTWETDDVNGFTTVTDTKEFQAFNDVCIGGDMNSYIHFNIHDKDRILGKFSGGGVIFSTAQGSTGVNKNNHGSIMTLSSKNWIVTGDKTNRIIRYTINPDRTSITFDSRTPVTAWIDGANHIISNVKKVELSQGDEVIVIFNDYNSFKKKRRI